MSFQFITEEADHQRFLAALLPVLDGLMVEVEHYESATGVTLAQDLQVTGVHGDFLVGNPWINLDTGEEGVNGERLVGVHVDTIVSIKVY